MNTANQFFSVTSKTCRNVFYHGRSSQAANRSGVVRYRLYELCSISNRSYSSARAKRVKRSATGKAPPKQDLQPTKAPVGKDETPPVVFMRESSLVAPMRDESTAKDVTGSSKDKVVDLGRPAPKYAYPERLLIWNAGVWRNAYIGINNIAPLVWMGWGFFFWAPGYVVLLPELEGLYALPAIIVSALPWVFTRWLTSPYVATVRIFLPFRARMSKDELYRFAANLPAETMLEFTTVGPLGLQNRVTTSLAKLSPNDSKFGIANIKRDIEPAKKTGLLEKYRRFVQGSTLYVGGDEGSMKSNAPGIWHAVMEHIERNALPRRRQR